MRIERIFLDWSRPALPAVVDQLIDHCQERTPCDLSQLIMVFPGRQAGRRFLELLVQRTGGRVVPPKILTVGGLPELLYTPKSPFASLFTQRLAWVQALKQISSESLRVIIAEPPSNSDLEGWLRFGDLLRRQHAELAADQLDFADVARLGKSVPGFNEVKRWTILSEVQEKYHGILDSLHLWDQQTARRRAVEWKECRTDRRIIAVGTVDLNRTMRAMLDQVADSVTAYIHAPQEWRSHFDEYGCVIPEKWGEQRIDLRDEQVQVVEDAPGQTHAVVLQLAALNGRFAMEEVTIAVPDEALAGPLQRLLEQWEIPTHWPLRRPLSASEPYRFLQIAADFLEGRRTDQFSELIRHPDVSERLEKEDLPADWLSLWDRYFNAHLSPKVGLSLGMDRDGRMAQSLALAVDHLLHPLMQEPAALSSWYVPISEVLLNLYGDARVVPGNAPQQQLTEACSLILQAFQSQNVIPSRLDPKVSASTAIRLVLEDIAGEFLPQSEPGVAVPLSGWLDMPLNDTPVAIVTSFNEGLVPSSVNHDLFLPNRLRMQLGLEDNSRRYARDAHALVSMLHSRQEVRLIVARRNGSGDTLFPSRLLFATGAEEIAQRVLTFYRGEESPSPIAPANPYPVAATSRFQIPRPDPVSVPRTILRVTEFRDYLASPYRYYLKHVLRLEELTDRLDELDAAAFGTLLHEVLNRFGESPLRDVDDESRLAHELSELLNQFAEEIYGSDPLPTIRIQIEQSRQRLKSFAAWQSRWRRAGWRIHSVERDSGLVPFRLGDGRDVRLKGRIDRIDMNEDTGDWAIFDYKTGDAGNGPQKTHRYQNQWCDLQLPLYRHLAREVTGDDEVQLGYIVLPRNNQVEHKFADWSLEDLEEADEVARSVGKKILDEEFWLELEHPPATLTEFNPICQDGVFGREAVV